MAEEHKSPPWIDEDASKQLPILCAQGEGQTLEYMKIFPENARELAKEIAAFATSNSGTILIGIDNEGECVGIPAATPAQRDEFLRRLEGICANAVKPSIAPSAKFAGSESRTALLVTVPKGSQPVYYANHVPYLRHITSSRPAEPHEVIALIEGTLRPQPQLSAAESIEETPDRRTQFLADLMRDLAPVIILGEELEHRILDPWLHLMRAQFANIASRLRDAAAEQISVDEQLDVRLLDAAEVLEHFAKLRLHLGSGDDLTAAAREAISKASGLMDEISPTVLAHVTRKQLKDELQVIRRRLAALDLQADKALESGSMEELQTRASQLGRQILNVAQYGVNRLAPNLRGTLTESGHQLHLSETERLYMDGGASGAKIVENIKSAILAFDRATAAALAST